MYKPYGKCTAFLLYVFTHMKQDLRTYRRLCDNISAVNRSSHGCGVVYGVRCLPSPQYVRLLFKVAFGIEQYMGVVSFPFSKGV